jgi:NAD(P)-dependent dehydrogenase (short-subunit alcohol dehydrogenase family)
MRDFMDKTAIVTGAGSGIGRACAISFARRGARVVLADIDPAAARESAAMIAAFGGQAMALRCDVAASEAFAELRTQAEGRFGPADIVMNNVGVLAMGRPEDIPLTEWRRVIDTNLLSVVASVQEFIPGMIARGNGHVVNTASFAGLYPYAWDRLPYAATKGAIVTMTEGLALYLKPQGIGVTLLCPGPVATNIGATKTVWTRDIGLRGPGSEFPLLDPAAVGEMVADAVESDRFLLVTDENVLPLLQRRAAGFDAFLDSQIAAFARPG